MDKRVVFAVAGSGKTTRLVEELDLKTRTLLITYTDNNCAEIRRRVIAKFGHIPTNITVSTYFTFLNSFCYRPLLLWDLKTTGISFDRPDKYCNAQKLTNRARYVTAGGRIYHARMAKALMFRGNITELKQRIERYYDKVCIDEVQDFGGHDFNLLKVIVKASVAILLVGDFYQHTYSTSTDGNVNKGLHDSYERFKQGLRGTGLTVDTTSLVKSFRCSTTVCSFIRDHIGIEIQPTAERTSNVVIVEDTANAELLFARADIVKLFFQEHYLYPCRSQTWGASKGQDHYEDVCVVLNATSWKKYQERDLRNLAALSKNKLYVACSRARGNLYLMPESLLKAFKAKPLNQHPAAA